MCIHIYIYIHIYLYMHTTFAHVGSHCGIHMCIYIHIYVLVSTYTYICIYTHAHIRGCRIKAWGIAVWMLDLWCEVWGSVL